MAAVEFPDGEWERTTARIEELTGLKANRFTGLWLGRLARGILCDLPEIATREKFDGLVMDQTCMGAESVCVALHLPMAVACCALTLHAGSRVPPFIFSWRCRTSLPFPVRNMLGLLLSFSAGWPVALEAMRFRLRRRLSRMSIYYNRVVRKHQCFANVELGSPYYWPLAFVALTVVGVVILRRESETKL